MVLGTIGGTKMPRMRNVQNFFKMIASLIADKVVGIILIGGDFNYILRQTVDRPPAGVGSMSKRSITLHAMMDELGLVDVWRHLHPRVKEYTFMSQVQYMAATLDWACLGYQERYLQN